MAQMVNLNFHQTFRPEQQYIAAVLEFATGKGFNSLKEISAQTGIPTGASSGKVEPHILYAYYMGLIEYEKKNGEYKLSRTSLGEVVYTEDPGLQEQLTILLCHCMMLREENGAILWSTVFKKIFPIYRSGIKKDMLLKELVILFANKVSSKNIAPFFGSYASYFDGLGLLKENEDIISINTMPFNKEYIYLYALVLYSYWEDKYDNQDEITSSQLYKLKFGNVFGWDNQLEYEALEQMADKEIIRMNRQLMPYTILKLSDKDKLIVRLYSELC